MAAIVGYTGDVALPSGGAEFNAWSARFERVTSETTAFGTSTVGRQNRAGLIDISGSATGAPETGNAPDINNSGLPASAGASMTLTVDAASSFTFVGLISGVGFDVDKNGASVVTYDFVSGDTDTLTETWA